MLTAHNGQTFDVSAPYTSGLATLAGSPVLAMDNSYRISQAATAAAAIIVLVLLVCGTLGLTRRVRRARTADGRWFHLVGTPALVYLAASIGLVTLVYFGLRAALHDVLVVSPAVLFAALPGASTIVTVTAGWLALAGITMLVAGTRRRPGRQHNQ